MTTFWDRNVDSGSTKYVDLGPCLTCQNHSDQCVVQLFVNDQST